MTGAGGRPVGRAGDTDAGREPGVVHMVGAGPGDPMLLTRRAARLLADADAVVAAGPATDAVAALAPSASPRYHVGPAPGVDAWPTARVVDLLARQAAAGRQVVRLEQGDVYVGSGLAAEAAALRARGVAVTVTPGVSAATAAALASGMVPVPGTTVTVARRAVPAVAPVRWEALAEADTGLVVLGDGGEGADPGLEDTDEVAARLMAGGAAASTPVALVHDASQPGARVVHTDLAGLSTAELAPTATAVVGPIRRGVRVR